MAEEEVRIFRENNAEMEQDSRTVQKNGEASLAADNSTETVFENKAEEGCLRTLSQKQLHLEPVRDRTQGVEEDLEGAPTE